MTPLLHRGFVSSGGESTLFSWRVKNKQTLNALCRQVSDEDVEEAAHYVRYAFAAYGFLLYIWSQPQYRFDFVVSFFPRNFCFLTYSLCFRSFLSTSSLSKSVPRACAVASWKHCISPGLEAVASSGARHGEHFLIITPVIIPQAIRKLGLRQQGCCLGAGAAFFAVGGSASGWDPCAGAEKHNNNLTPIRPCQASLDGMQNHSATFQSGSLSLAGNLQAHLHCLQHLHQR